MVYDNSGSKDLAKKLSTQGQEFNAEMKICHFEVIDIIQLLWNEWAYAFPLTILFDLNVIGCQANIFTEKSHIFIEQRTGIHRLSYKQVIWIYMIIDFCIRFYHMHYSWSFSSLHFMYCIVCRSICMVYMSPKQTYV